jgi:HPt (histidine-containing phosphotransfer) domain-containing protein
MDPTTQQQQLELTNLGVAVDDAVKRFAGKYELYVKTLRKFAADLAEKGITEPQKALAMEAEELRGYVHSLKGVAGNLALNTAYEMLVEVEQSIKEGQTDFVKYEKLYVYLPDLARRITALLNEGETHVHPAGIHPVGDGLARPAGNETEYRQLLTELKENLLIGKASECERLAGLLGKKSWEGGDSALIQQLQQAIDGYDYGKAMEIIDKC